MPELFTNGVRLYYKKRGAWGSSSRPVLLLHGNGESMEIYDESTKPLYDKFAFLALDSRGHGKSQKPCDISYELMAKDVISLLEHENITSCDVVGFSDGAIIAFLLAMNEENNHKINKIIAIGGNVNPKGLKFSVRKEIHRDKKLFKKQGDAFGVSLCDLMLKQPKIGFKGLAKIKAQAVIVVGSKDMVKRSHTEKITRSIPNSKLIIIKGAGHFIPQDRPKELMELISNELLHK